MSELTSQIQELIQQDALQHSMSKEALKRMLDEINDLTEQNKRLSNRNKNLEEERIRGGDRNTELNDKIIEWQKRELALISREQVVAQKEFDHEVGKIKLEYEKARVDDHKVMMSLLLRNRVVNQQILSSDGKVVPGTPGYNDQWGNPQPGYPGGIQQVETKSNIQSEDT